MLLFYIKLHDCFLMFLFFISTHPNIVSHCSVLYQLPIFSCFVYCINSPDYILMFQCIVSTHPTIFSCFSVLYQLTRLYSHVSVFYINSPHYILMFQCIISTHPTIFSCCRVFSSSTSCCIFSYSNSVLSMSSMFSSICFTAIRPP